jgi:4-amino-4-deoxy-L-arabinose transferase-like glycosyltransferase
VIGRPAFRLQTVLLGALFGMLAILTWQRSGDLVIDWGRELYTALSVSEGRGIPLDVLLLFGPVSPLVNGTVFRLAGERTGVLLVSNLVFLGVALVLVYDLANRLFGRRSAFLCSVVFLFLSGFPHLVRVGNYNFLTPYSHGLTHGLVLGFLVLASLFRALERGNPVWWLLAGISAGLATCTKPEIGLATLLTLICGVVLARHIRPEGRSTHLLALVGLILALGITSYSVGRGAGVSPTVVFEPYRSALTVITLDFPFYRRSSGIEANLGYALVGLAGLLALILIFLVPGRAPERSRRRPGGSHVSRQRLRGAAAAVVLFMLVSLRSPFAWLQLARILPWVTAAVLLTSAWALLLRRWDLSRRQLQKATQLLLLSLFSAGLLAKMGFRTHFDHYGFALSAPACMLGVGLLCRHLPARVRLERPLSRLARGVAPVVTLFLVLSAATQSAAFYSRRTFPVGDGATRMLVFPSEFDPRTATFDLTLNALADSKRFTSDALILPEGSMFNYMLRTPSSIPVASLMPLEIELLGPKQVLLMIQSAAPELIVVAEPDLSAWHAFDLPESNPYLEVRRWVESKYCETGRIESRSSGEDRLEVTFFEACGASGRIQNYGTPTVATAYRVMN